MSDQQAANALALALVIVGAAVYGAYLRWGSPPLPPWSVGAAKRLSALTGENGFRWVLVRLRLLPALSDRPARFVAVLAVAGGLIPLMALLIWPALGDLVPLPSTTAVSAYAGALMGATASAIGVVFVFVFVVVESVRASGGAKSSASYASVLWESWAFWSLATGLGTLALSGAAFTLATVIPSGVVGYWTASTAVMSGVTAFAALVTLSVSLFRAIRLLAPGNMESMFQREVRRSVFRAAREEVERHGRTRWFGEAVRDMNESVAPYLVRAADTIAGDLFSGNVLRSLRSQGDREVVDVNLKRLRRLAKRVHRADGKGAEVLVLRPGSGRLPPHARTLAVVRPRAPITALLLPPLTVRRVRPEGFSRQLVPVYQSAVRAVRRSDAVALSEAMESLTSAYDGLLEGRASAYGPLVDEKWSLFPFDVSASNVTADRLAERVRDIWQVVDREQCGWDLVSPIATFWLRTCEAALARQDPAVLHSLSVEMSAAARRRFGVGSEVAGMLVHTFMDLVGSVGDQVASASTPSEVVKTHEAVVALLDTWTGLLIAASDAEDFERFVWLADRLRTFAIDYGRTRTGSDGCRVLVGENVEDLRVEDARFIDDAVRVVSLVCVSKMAKNLSAAPNRSYYGRPPLGPLSREEMERFVRHATQTAGGLAGLIRAYRVIYDDDYPRPLLKEALRCRWRSMSDVGPHSATLSSDVHHGFALGGIHEVSGPRTPRVGLVCRDDLWVANIKGPLHVRVEGLTANLQFQWADNLNLLPPAVEARLERLSTVVSPT